MTPFEAETIALGHLAATYQLLTVLISLAALVAAVIAGVTIWMQLRASQWNAMLQFEMDMNSRYRELAMIGQELAELGPLTDTQRRLMVARKEALVESYLNSLDRFASSILHGQFPDKALRPDYRGYVESALREFKDHFGAGTRFRNTLKLHDRWVK